MAQAPAMPVFTDALIGDTTHLSAEEFGSYLLILFATWRNNGVPFADNDLRLARICRCTEKRWIARLRPSLVSFFDLSHDTWFQKRLQKEWIWVAEQHEVNSIRGKAGAQARWLKNKKTVMPEALPEHMPEHCLSNGTPYPYQEDKKESSLTGAKESRPLTGAVRTKRRVPGDWQPDESGVAYALDKAGWVGVRLAEEIEHFRNRSERDGKLYFSVDAAWRTCVQLGHKFDLERNQRNGTKQSPGEKLFEGAFRAAERWEREHPADIEPNSSVVVPLLDSRRRSGDA